MPPPPCRVRRPARAGPRAPPRRASERGRVGRWLDGSTPRIAAELLAVAAEADSPLVMTELRHVAGAPSRRDGAVVAPPGDFLVHAVGALGRAPRERVEAAFARLRAVWSAADTGRTPGSWIEGAAAVPGALPPDERDRAVAVADAVDPDGRIARSRLLA